MATISRPLVLGLLESDGRYSDDPIPHSIWRYRNNWGKDAYSVCYSQSAAFSLCNSPFACAPVLLWGEEGLTAEGRKELTTIPVTDNHGEDDEQT